MRILVLGAYGIIGSAVLSRLHRDGHSLIATGRSIATARRRFGFAEWVAADFHELLNVDDWMPLLVRADAVVNCVGAFQSGSRDRLDRVHVDAPTALFAACERAGVRRLVHISAIGADAGAPAEFGRSKALAERALRETALDWLILRPGLVLAPGAYGGSALLFGLTGVPLVTPLIGGGSPIQVVAVEDVAETVAWAMRPGTPARLSFDLAHPQPHSLRNIVTGLRDWLGFSRRPVWEVPRAVMAVVAVVADGLGWLGWRSPARSTGVSQLATGVVGDPSCWMRETGIRPRSFDELLAERPATLQDRWFARLYWLKPLAIAGLSLFWVATGLLALGPGTASAVAYLADAEFGQRLAMATVVGGAAFDIAIGLLLLVRRLAKPVLVTMLVVTLGYLAAGTAIAPHLWIDPLGPLTKVLPLLLATLFTLAIVDER